MTGAALRHPLTQPFGLPASPLVVAIASAAVVLLVAAICPWVDRPPRERPDPRLASWVGSLSTPQMVSRVFAVVLLGLAIAAGRAGLDDELENLAPALIVGAAWPLLVLISVTLGAVWRWLDPWDGVARFLARDDRNGDPGGVWPAAFVAIGWVWYLSAYQDPLDPRSVGAVLAAYTLFTVTGCLAVGRVRWLATSEPLGIILSWGALLPRRRLADWEPPRGAEAVLGAFAGGVLFGAVRRSELWGDLNTVDGALLVSTAGLVLSCAVVAGLLLSMAEASKSSGARVAVARAAVPAVAGIIVAVAMDRNRLFTSVQLLPGLLGDPFGRGWDLFGPAGARLNPAPLGTTGLLVAQLAVLLAGHVAGAVVGAWRVRRGARGPVAAGLSVLVAASVIAIASH
jgi:hypothetical protein